MQKEVYCSNLTDLTTVYTGKKYMSHRYPVDGSFFPIFDRHDGRSAVTVTRKTYPWRTLRTCKGTPKSVKKGSRRNMKDSSHGENRNDTEDGSFFAILNGNGGKSAAKFANKHPWKTLCGRQHFAVKS